MRMMDGGDMSHTRLLRYIPADTQRKHELVGIIETKDVRHLLQTLKQNNPASDVLVQDKHASAPWALVLCMLYGHDTLFRVLDDGLLLRDIPPCCAEALVIFTKSQMLQHTLNVLRGPTSPSDFDFCAQHIAPLKQSGAHPQLQLGVMPMRCCSPQSVSSTTYIICFEHCG
jgi:hypothetical protein